MEVYKITCKSTGKIYIGSTKYDKEYRWTGIYKGRNTHSLYSHMAYMERGDNAPLYQDMRKYGLDDFVLETIETLDEGNQHDIQLLEDKWIKYYWDLLGEDKLYNRMRSAFTNSDGNQLITPEARANRAKTMMEKYGTLMYVDKDARRRCYETNIKNRSGIYSKKAIRNRSNIYLFDNKEFYGIPELYQYLKNKKYELTFAQVHHWAITNGKQLSKENTKKYPELKESVIVKRREWREKK